MFKILDRYVVREVLLPFFLWLLVITFVLEMPPILDYGERLIEKGVAWSIIVRVLALLLPQALGVTIPISLLLGVLIGLGRLSTDRFGTRLLGGFDDALAIQITGRRRRGDPRCRGGE